MSNKTENTTENTIAELVYDEKEHNKKRGSLKRSLGTVQDNIHGLLMHGITELFVAVRDGEWKVTGLEKDLMMLASFGGTIRNKQSIHPWVESVCGVVIEEDKDGNIKISKDKKAEITRDRKQFDTAKDTPYYKMAKPEKPITQPEVSFKAVGAMLARQKYLGQEPDWDDLLEEMKKEYKSAQTSKGMEKWKEKTRKREKEKK